MKNREALYITSHVIKFPEDIIVHKLSSNDNTKTSKSSKLWQKRPKNEGKTGQRVKIYVQLGKTSKKKKK